MLRNPAGRRTKGEVQQVPRGEQICMKIVARFLIRLGPSSTSIERCSAISIILVTWGSPSSNQSTRDCPKTLPVSPDSFRRCCSKERSGHTQVVREYLFFFFWHLCWRSLAGRRASTLRIQPLRVSNLLSALGNPNSPTTALLARGNL